MRLLLVLGALLVAAPADAHQETVAYSRLVIQDSGAVEYALKIPVQDLAESLGRKGHAELKAPEVRGAEQRLFDHFQPLIGVSSGGRPCPVERNGIEVPEDERLYGEMRFVFHCPPGVPVTLDYRVFFDVDPGHMGMLEVESPGGKARAELIIERPRWEVDASGEGPPQIRTVDSAAALSIEKSQPAAITTPVVAEPASDFEAPGRAITPDRREVSDAQPPVPRAPRDRGNWMLVALVILALGSAALAMQLARRRASSR